MLRAPRAPCGGVGRRNAARGVCVGRFAQDLPGQKTTPPEHPAVRVGNEAIEKFSLGTSAHAVIIIVAFVCMHFGCKRDIKKAVNPVIKLVIACAKLIGW